jgi:hypothetical protein
MQVEIFNQINLKARNTCQEADKVHDSLHDSG